jgi:isopentenyl phosphate kinase
MTVVLKLGGSVVTEKDRRETVDEDALAALAATLAAGRPERLVIAHGGGSFGHPAAEGHGVSRTAGSRDAEAVRAIHGAMRRLNDAVVAALADAGVPAVPVHPLSAASRDGEGALAMPPGAVATMLGEGFVPVTHGDVVAHAGEGVTVLSGDELVVSLASGLGADRVGLCSTVPGVLDAEGAVIERVTAFEEVADAVGASDATDVTGGMARKVRELLALDAPAHVFDPDGLASFLGGGEPGTRVG